MNMNISKNDTFRVLAENVKINNNTWVTGINNNDLIIGPSGSGKTRGYVIPNIICSEESLIVADTKGNLQHKLGPDLKEKGYKIISLDFKNLKNNEYGYNPLSFIRFDIDTDSYNEQDIYSVAEAMFPALIKQDPFWDEASKMYLVCIISYVMNFLPYDEHTMDSVMYLSNIIGSPEFKNIMNEIVNVHPTCLTSRIYKIINDGSIADRTTACIKLTLSTRLSIFNNSLLLKICNNPNQINFKKLSQEKTILFLNISDVDRSKDLLINLLYTQAFQELCDEADSNFPDFRLNIPVRFILDDFATNTIIPHFDNIISVIRSREIYVSIIIQSISQLDGLYGTNSSRTIINNCDNLLYLGGQDVETAQYMSFKLNKPSSSILNLELNKAYLFTRGEKPKEVKKLKLNDGTYKELFNLYRYNDTNLENICNESEDYTDERLK